ncbi:MAG: crossover junction endodeoxyribonuclease RuvC [Deltaproteobacteria bacterium]|nr:MAG: crossover junction endodeoxyribonuclease RuvC [Deltaproteobacteria bacterium]
MRVLGIDPGSTVTGFGIVEKRRGRVHLIESGCVRTQAAWDMGERLKVIHEGLAEVFARHTLDAVAIEAVFKHKSSASALTLGQARGVAILAAAQAGFVAHPYNPMTVKRSIGAHGRADKHAVRKVLTLLLGEEIPGPLDASDAVAIAVTHCAHARRVALTRPA